jgi:hypothetical protein
MNAKALVFLLLLASSLGSQAQSARDYVDINESEKLKSSTGSIYDIVGMDETSIYALKNRGRRYYISRYNKDLQEEQSAQIDLKFLGMNQDPEYLTLHGNRLWLFTSYVNRGRDELQLYRSFINPKNLRRDGKAEMVAAVPRSGKIFKSEGNFNIRFSRERSKMAVVTHYPFARRENERMMVTVYASDKEEKIWEREINLPYREDLFSVERTRIDDRGNFYVLGKRYGDGTSGKVKEKSDGEKNYDYLVVGYFNNGKDKREYVLKLEDKFISDLQIAINESGDMICAGFYRDSPNSGLAGTYFMRLNPKTKEVMTQNMKEFNIDFIMQNFSPKAKKKAKKKDARGKSVGLIKYELDEMVLRDDGGVMLVGEQYFVDQVTYIRPGPNGTTSTQITYHYYYNDIIVVNIAPNGLIEWTDKIPKRQHTTNDGGFFSSYLLGAKGDKIYFIFNDNPKNLNLSQNPGIGKFASFTRQRTSIVTLVVLDIEGRNRRLSLLSLKDEGMLSRPKVSEQVDPDTLILIAQKGKSEKLYRLKLKD